MKLPRLRALRERRMLTQEELSAQSGVSRGTIIRIEMGLGTYPRTAKKLAAALKVKASELLEPAPPPEPTETPAAE